MSSRNRIRRGAVAAGAVGLAFAALAGVTGAPAGAVVVLDQRLVGVPPLEAYSATNLSPLQQWAGTADVKPLKGDFNGDGVDDFFMYGPGAAADALWISKPAGTGDSIQDQFTVKSASITGTFKPFVGDFDGNGTDDIFWYAPGTAQDSVSYYRPAGLQAKVITAISGTYQPIVGDFDQNDGVPSDDIFWYGQANAETVWSGRSDRTFQTRTFGTQAPQNAKVMVGNFTADASQSQVHQQAYYPDLFFYTPGTAADAVWSGRGDGTYTVTADQVNGDYTPFAGNFDQGLPAWAGGLTDIFWYAAGTAKDSVWINQGGGDFTGTVLNVNGTYKPFIIPGTVGPDTIVWNNLGGVDSIWQTDGSQGSWHYQSEPWFGPDLGARTPYVGFFDDGLTSAYFGGTNPLTAVGGGGPVLFSPKVADTTTTTMIENTPVNLPRADVFWFSLGNATGQTEYMWKGTRTQVTLQTTYGEDPTTTTTTALP